MFDSEGKPISMRGALGAQGRATREGHFPEDEEASPPRFSIGKKPVAVKHVDYKDFPIVKRQPETESEIIATKMKDYLKEMLASSSRKVSKNTNTASNENIEEAAEIISNQDSSSE